MIKKLIVFSSDKMSTNKKQGRNEDSLVRMPKISREFFDFGDSDIKLSNMDYDGPTTIHQAFSADIRRAKKLKNLTTRDLKHVGFVTSKVFEKLPGKVIIDGVKEVEIERFKYNTLIGADPEFLLFDNDNNVIRANNILQKEGQLGSDGAMIEIRPTPAENPKDLINNIRFLLSDKDLTNPIKDLNWVASVYHKDDVRDYPVGGHIHLDNPKGIKKLDAPSKVFLFAVINKILDEFLAIPLIKIDGVDLGKFRRSECQMAMGNVGYGYYGEWRLCDGRLEHRTLSGMWLMHPDISECVIGVAKAVADSAFDIVENASYNNDVFTHKDVDKRNHKFLYRQEFDDWDSIKLAKEMMCTKSSSYMSSMLNASRATSINKKFLNDWYMRLKNISAYNKYSEYIDKLYNILILPRKEVIKVGFDIKENWLNGKNLAI